MTDWHLELHPEAVAEAREAVQWYAARNPEIAQAFVRELDRIIFRIQNDPERFPLYLAGTRRLLFPEFPYTAIYRIKSPRVQLIAFAHSRRRPRYWQGRKVGE